MDQVTLCDIFLIEMTSNMYSNHKLPVAWTILYPLSRALLSVLSLSHVSCNIVS